MQLKDIIRAIPSDISHYDTLLGDLKTGVTVDQNVLSNFVKDFDHSGGETTIDYFLANRPDWEELGKRVIAHCLLRSENLAKAGRVLWRSEKGDDWYGLLWSAVQRDLDLSTKTPSFPVERFGFVTFNYDRSLEYYFYHAVKSLHGVGHDEALSFVESMKITHVYGSLGQLKNVPVGEAITSEVVARAADSLETMATTLRARSFASLLRGAEKLCFLGFGFHPQNLELLGVHNLAGKNGTAESLPRVYGTSIGMYGEELSRAMRRFDPLLDRHGKLRLGAEQNESQRMNVLDCYTLLRRYPILH